MKTILRLSLYLLMAFFVISCASKKELVVSQKPDRPVYVRETAPGEDYVWVEGDFVVRNGKYVWKKGHWVKAKNKMWVEGDWQRKNEGWTWRRGFWSNPTYAKVQSGTIYQ